MRTISGGLLAAVLLCIGLTGCGGASASGPTTPPADTTWKAIAAACTAPGVIGSCDVSGWAGRPYRVYVPSRAAIASPQAVVLLFHGGSGNAAGALQITCPPGAGGLANPASPDCLQQVAEREGFVVVVPNGVSSPGDPESRTWNAGGGQGGWQCVSGFACTSGAK